MTMDAFTSHVTGWFFVAAAAMIWAGWTFLPHRIGTFVQPIDFARVDRSLRTWIWLYRFHLFGYLVAIMALVALGSVLSESAARILIWPGIAVCGIGLIVTALAHAYYYHFGAWGAVDMREKSRDAIERFVERLSPSNEYVTCLVRFGRVFFGLGQVVLGLGLLYGGVLPVGIGLGALIFGLAAMALTMGLPDDLHYYNPVFHANAIWLAAIGVVVML